MLINLRNALMAGKRLPYDAEVEFLQSTGTQWVNIYTFTGSETSLRYNIDFVITQDSSSSQDCVLGVSSLGNVGPRLLRYKGFFYYSCDSSNAVVGQSASLNQRYDIDFTYNSDGTIESSINGGATKTYHKTFYSSPGRFNYLFGSTGNSMYAMIGRCYRMKMWADSTLIRDFIPVRVGNVGAMYDRRGVGGMNSDGTARNDGMYFNRGTGDFVLGQDVVPVEYLQSKGTQWIDTGTPTADKYIFECLFTDATTDIKLFGNSYAYGRYRDLSIYNSRYRGTSIGTSSNEWDRIEIDVAQPRLTVTRSGSTVGSATSWWSSYTGANPDTQYGTALPFGGHINAHGTWYGTNRVTCFYVAQGVGLRTRLFESWLGSELIEKLLPVRVGTEGAMMDVLTRRIYRNQGTGAFTYGNDLKYPIPAE